MNTSQKINDFGKKITRKMMRVAFFLGMIFYLLFSLSLGWNFVKYSAYARLSPEKLPVYIHFLLAQNLQEKALDALHLYPRERSAAMLAQLENSAPEFPSLFYFELSRRAVFVNDMEAALFWGLLGQMRLNFDGIRCPSQKTLNLIEIIRNAQTPMPVQELLKNDLQAFDRGAQKVLDWSTQHPPQAGPGHICNMAMKMFPREQIAVSPQEEWPAAWEQMRTTTEGYLAQRAKNR